MFYEKNETVIFSYLKASVEEEVIAHRSEIEKNAIKVFKLKQLVSCLILTISSQEKDR